MFSQCKFTFLPTCHVLFVSAGVLPDVFGGLAKTLTDIPADQWFILCFPASATVQLEGGITSRMDQLQLGDRVLTVLPNGSTSYSDVYIFGHRLPNKRVTYLRIYTSGNISIHMSGSHYIHVARGAACLASPRVACAVTLPARLLQLGDVVFTVRPMPAGSSIVAGLSDHAVPTTIVSISKHTLDGMYAPFTLGGSIVVDGVLAHSMPEWFVPPWFHNGPLKHHMAAFYHASLAPVRLLYRLFPRRTHLANRMVYGSPELYPEGWATMTWGQIARVVLDAFVLASEDALQSVGVPHAALAKPSARAVGVDVGMWGVPAGTGESRGHTQCLNSDTPLLEEAYSTATP
jgi:hypothetical protein